MKKVLGLDIGTNSIGWAVIENDVEKHEGKIIKLGSRIIPMEGREKDFEAGLSVSKNADRRLSRGARRLLQRYRLRRTRLINVLRILEWLPNSFPTDFKQIQKFNINEFLPFESNTINEAIKIFNVNNISSDWLIYYVRTKALTQKISLTELARLLYHFNQRRGFKSSRKDIKEVEPSDQVKYPIKEKYIDFLTILKLIDTQENSKYGKIFSVIAINNLNEELTAKIIRKSIPDWEGKVIEIEVTKTTTKNGDISYEFRLPDRTDWEKMKLALEQELVNSKQHPGEYHFHNLLVDRNYRIKDRIIDRKFYKDELSAILETQAVYYPFLKEKNVKPEVIDSLYKHNSQKRKELSSNDLIHLFINDIIYFQRPLKSQKHLIAECQYERKSDPNGNLFGVKVSAKSSPIFQEFRIWQDIHNLKIFKVYNKIINGKFKNDEDITNIILTTEAKEILFDLFNSKTSISNQDILKNLSIVDNTLDTSTYRTNYPTEKEFKGNETKTVFRRVFNRHNYKVEGEKLLQNKDSLNLLWHIVYSLDNEKNIYNAIKNNFNLPDDITAHISKLPPFKLEYGSLSSKAMSKLLCFMRCGKYYDSSNISADIRERIEKIIDGEVDDTIPLKVRDYFNNMKFRRLEDFSGLPPFIAAYIVYGRHSERENSEKFEKWSEIKLLEPNTLRNPVVEQITNETLQIVKDIWKSFGRPDEIHIELSRDLKKNATERQKISKQMMQNENDRKRVRAILKELNNANADSPSDMERLRLWEETGNRYAKESLPKFSKEPSKQEIDKYLLWGEQNHISPYTGRVIPLSRLFTSDYEIEHIIPKSRFFDDSFANKTICESKVNKFKDNFTAMELINEYSGYKIPNSDFSLFDIDSYTQHIKSTFFGKKRKNFLSDSIPEDFVERQINDTRYIGKKVAELLYPIAQDAVIFSSGSITSELKEKWGLHRVWKTLLKPRFERLEALTGETLIEFDKEHNDLRFKKDYKRIDHRHHALDALIIAATSREHIRYLNSLNSASNKDYLNRKFRLVKSGIREFNLPWGSFTKEAKESLECIVVSHKNRVRVLSKGFNLYTKWVLENGKWIKKSIKQENSNLFSIRKSMFKEPLGLIKLAEYRDIKIDKALEIQFDYLTKFKSKLQSRIADPELRDSINLLIKNCEFDLTQTINYVKENPILDEEGNKKTKLRILEFNEYAAKRVTLDKSFDIKKIDKIPYANQRNNKLVKTLKEHLKDYDNKPETAFSGEGLEHLAKRYGKPITKVTTYEEVGNKQKFKGKFVEADKGSNLFFVIYENVDYPYDRIINQESSIPLTKAIEVFANGGKKEDLASEIEGYRKIILSPNDLVYVPIEGEDLTKIYDKPLKDLASRLYKVVSFTKGELHCLPSSISSLISPYDTKLKFGEFGSLNKSERSLEGFTIKKVCIKMETDRLGSISKK